MVMDCQISGFPLSETPHQQVLGHQAVSPSDPPGQMEGAQEEEGADR